jgi:phosphotransferase system  glucose/maltose/N-acetylglucosamine-specific IIC component
MAKWIGIAIFFIAMVIMYLVIGTDIFKVGEEEDKQIQQEYQKEDIIINEMEKSE